MTLASKTFDQLLNFTRASGATRVNDAGLIVGVDFSVTSNTIGTGAKTFTLAADLAVNRDWRVGENVIAVSQAGAVGTMTGTVTSYSPASQELVINVTESTGTGTGTNWRIGSLEFRRDFDPVTLAPRGGLVEGGATNGFQHSQDFTNAYWTKNGGAVGTKVLSPDGSFNADVFVPTAADELHRIYRPAGMTNLVKRTHIFFLKNIANCPYVTIGSSTSASQNAAFDLDNLQVIQTINVIGKSYIYDVGNGWRACVYQTDIGTTVSILPTTSFVAIGGIQTQTFTGNEQLGIWGGMFLNDVLVKQASYIPTTTTAVSRAADIPLLQGDVFTSAINPAQGTLVIEAEPSDGVQGTVVSLSDGTASNELRIGQKQSGTRSSIRAIASDGVTDVIAATNTLRSNGVDYAEVNTGIAATMRGVANNGSQFLVAGSLGAFASGDGTTFVQRSIERDTLNGAHFGIGRFVIAAAATDGIGSVRVSTDGLSFRRINITGLTQSLNEVTSNGTNQYVAVGNGGVIYTSSDAEVWTSQTSGTISVLNCVHWFGGRYVAGGNNSGTERYSDDGITWTPTTGVAGSMIDVYHNGTDLWVFVGSAGRIYTSPDGATWTSRASGVTDALRGIHFADGLWVAVGDTGTVVTSPDGITWTDRTATSGTTQLLFEVNFFNGKFYYIGSSSAIGENTAANIVAGVTWTLRTANVIGSLIGIATNGTRLLICGSGGAIATSDNGTDFTSRTGNIATLNGAAFGNGTYVVVGNAVNGSGLIATVDPTTFAYTRRVSNTVQSLNKVRQHRGNFYASGNASRMIRSVAGDTWNELIIGGTAFNVQDTADSGGLIVAVGSGGRFSTSVDGLTWTTSALTGATTQQLNGADFANGLFVAVGNAGTIITSPNGTAWTLRTSNTTANLYAVHYSTRDQRWYAAGDNGVIVRAVDPTGEWMPIANGAIARSVVDGLVQANPELDNLIPAQTNRVAFRFAPNGYIAAVNDNPAVTDSTGTVPASTALAIGLSGDQSGNFNGYIRKLAFRTDAATAASIEGLASGAIDMFTTEILP